MSQEQLSNVDSFQIDLARLHGSCNLCLSAWSANDFDSQLKLATWWFLAEDACMQHLHGGIMPQEQLSNVDSFQINLARLHGSCNLCLSAWSANDFDSQLKLATWWFLAEDACMQHLHGGIMPQEQPSNVDSIQVDIVRLHSCIASAIFA